ncbi:FAD-binding oxidoreductase [Patescibacteria group bacterium]|nr:FAD-binding oxidoreductase [Patescibacteria group bacterium]
MTTPELRSPWLDHLESTRTLTTLEGNHSTDIAIVGAGIAGISTAYFLLKNTKKRIAIIEANRVAHGATGHNAGQLVSYFERPFSDIVREFGSEKAAEGQKAVESAWDLLEEIYRDLSLKTPLLSFEGYAGCLDLTELIIHLRDNEERAKAGIDVEPILVSTSFKARRDIPAALKKFYKTVPHKKILTVLQTHDERYVAAIIGRKGCLNSAQFSEEVVSLLLKRYSKRLFLVERTPVKTVRLYTDSADLLTGTGVVHAGKVILCTNGFEHFQIENTLGSNINGKFHHLVRGSIGYMAAFIEEPSMPPTAISYLPAHKKDPSLAYESDPYYYLTRRPYEQHPGQNLICIGGPESLLDNTNKYSKIHPYSKRAKKFISDFLKETYLHTGRRLKYSHLWHGLMGYTPNGIRCIGTEPCNSVLLYNLGCNGVGILPSLYGGLRISQIIRGDVLKPSIFDPADQRCIIPKRKKGSIPLRQQRSIQQKTTWSLIALFTAILLYLFLQFIA